MTDGRGMALRGPCRSSWVASLIALALLPAGAAPARAQEPTYRDLEETLNVADSLVGDGRWDEAEPWYERGLDLADGLYGEWSIDALEILLSLADVYAALGRLSDESATLESLVERARDRDSPWHPTIAEYLLRLGGTLGQQERWAEASEALRSALEIAERNFGPSDWRIGRILNDLAVSMMESGAYLETERLFRRSIEIYEANTPSDIPSDPTLPSDPRAERASPGEEGSRRAGPHDRRIAATLDNLGQLYQLQGEAERAERVQLRALEIRESVYGREHPSTAITMSNLSLVYRDLGRLDEAETLLAGALEATGDSLRVLINLADVRVDRRDVAGAMQTLALAEAVIDRASSPNPADRALVRFKRGILELVRGSFAEAEVLLGDAHGFFSAAGDAPRFMIAAASHLALAVHAQGRVPEAIDLLATSLIGLEDLRPNVGGGDLTRAAFFGGFNTEYDMMVAWQLEMGDVDSAFEWSERGRARTLLDQLDAARVDLRAGIPPTERLALERREREVAAFRSEIETRITLLAGRDDLPPSERDARIRLLSDSLRLADQAFLDVFREIKNASAMYREQLTDAGEVVGLREAAALVPEGGLILSYQVGELGSHVLVVPQAGEEPFGLPLVLTDEDARTLQTVAGPLTDSLLAAVIGGSADAGSARRALSRSRDDTDSSGPRVLRTLWRALVPEEIREDVLAATEVVIVPDGWLHQLPFEALIVDSDETGRPRFWLDLGPITRYAPSVTVLHNLERRPPSNARGLLTLSDVIYDPDEVPGVDPAHVSDPVVSTGESNRAAYARGGATLSRLPGTARETEAILSSFAPLTDRMSITVLQQGGAREPAVRDAIGAQRYVHLATHGLVDERRNDMFASLAVTPPPAVSVDPADDGFLQLHEIYELPLGEAELAVLSACDTNRAGQPENGEGVFALSRGFLAAGARRVVASQWAVDDESTANLMRVFFGSIASQEANGRVDYARALRDARRFVRDDPETADPYFWAPFVLTGRR